MNSILSKSAALATVMGVGISGYVIGNSVSNGSSPNAVDITITNAISGLPQDKQESAKELMEPILEMVKAISDGTEKSNNDSIKQYEDRFKEKLEEFSLVSYQASKSPFIPPKTKAQFFCNNSFTFFYQGTSSKTNTNAIYYTIDGNRNKISLGEHDLFTSDTAKLKFTYLEYDKNKKGPILQYKCLDKG